MPGERLELSRSYKGSEDFKSSTSTIPSPRRTYNSTVAMIKYHSWPHGEVVNATVCKTVIGGCDSLCGL